MDWDDVWLGFTIATVVALALALKAVVDGALLRSELAGLAERFSLLDRSVVRLTQRFDEGARPSETAPPTEPPPPVVTAPTAISAEPAAIPEEPAARGEPAEPAAPPPEPQPGRGWEQLLVEHWLVWLGGAAMALGGAFLVKLSIDQGLLTPFVRVVLGIVFGIALSVAAEWLRRHEPPQDTEPATPPTFRRRSPPPARRRCSPASTRRMRCTISCPPGSLSGCSP